MIAYGFTMAMSHDRPVDVSMSFGADLSGVTVFRKGISEPRLVPDCGRPEAQRSTMFFETRSELGEVRKVFVDEVDGVLVKGGPMKDGER